MSTTQAEPTAGVPELPGDAQCRETVALASRVLEAQGLGDLIWGHASIRDPAGRGAWLKSAQWGLGEVTEERVHLVSPEGEVVSGVGPRHSEYVIHTEILAARPDVGGVVHTHSPFAVGLPASGMPLLPLSHAGARFTPPEIPRFTETSDLLLTPELGQSLAAVLGSSTAAFLVNHGMVTVGPTLQSATVAAVLLERACRQQAVTAMYGGWPTWSPPEEAISKRRHLASEKAVDAVWEHLVRTLPPPPQL